MNVAPYEFWYFLLLTFTEIFSNSQQLVFLLFVYLFLVLLFEEEVL